jgi:RNA polymerase sigma-70 factor (sigma-E family)
MAKPRDSAPERAMRPTRAAEFDAWAVSRGPTLLRFAHVITGNDHDAADAVQDALIAVYTRWRRLNNSDAHDAYARRVIVNATISRWRRFGRRERLTEVAEVHTQVAPDHASQASDGVVAHALMSSLPPQQRAAVSLRFYDDLAFAQIADILGCSEGTARGYVHRALARLRQELSPIDSPPSALSPKADHA